MFSTMALRDQKLLYRQYREWLAEKGGDSADLAQSWGKQLAVFAEDEAFSKAEPTDVVKCLDRDIRSFHGLETVRRRWITI